MKRTKNDARLTAKRNRTETPITATEALQLLASAVNYCQKAGLKVNYSNDSTQGLTLYLPQCKIGAEGGAARFVLDIIATEQA